MKKSVNMISREGVWNTVKNKGVEADFIETIKCLYKTPIIL